MPGDRGRTRRRPHDHARPGADRSNSDAKTCASQGRCACVPFPDFSHLFHLVAGVGPICQGLRERSNGASSRVIRLVGAGVRPPRDGLFAEGAHPCRSRRTVLTAGPRRPSFPGRPTPAPTPRTTPRPSAPHKRYVGLPSDPAVVPRPAPSHRCPRRTTILRVVISRPASRTERGGISHARASSATIGSPDCRFDDSFGEPAAMSSELNGGVA